jgi:uncharacterized membrane protein YphA (DoxX/SURF4 family)
MSHVSNAPRAVATSSVPLSAARPAYQAYLILRIGFVVLPIVMGVDKFFDFLGNWDMYLAPLVPRLTHLDGHTFMMVVGVIEIVAGLLVAFRPRFGAFVIVFWLCGIIVNLLLIPGFYDIAMRDFGLLLGALALARLSREFGRNPVV